MDQFVNIASSVCAVDQHYICSAVDQLMYSNFAVDQLMYSIIIKIAVDQLMYLKLLLISSYSIIIKIAVDQLVLNYD